MPKSRPIQTIADQVYSILRKNICEGQYPPGFWMQEVELCEQLGVSRSPVRESLMRSLTCASCWRDTPSAAAAPT